MPQPSPTHYDRLSRAFHWLTAIVVLSAFILGPGGFGRLMHEGVDPASRSDIVWHETLGVLVLVLTLLRLLWLVLRPAAPQFPMARWMYWTAKLVHSVLWLLLLALPLTAFMALGSESHPLTLLGGLRVEQMPWIANAPIAQWVDWGDVHKFLGDAIMWLAGAHAGAAIFHQVVLKDGVLLSMLPQKKGR
jgi:cytochrome b561